MSADPMNITLRRLSGAAFEAKNGTGQSILLEGPPSVGGLGEGMRPMEACLAALAGCSAVDVLMILQQQHEPITDLEIRVHGERSAGTPAVFTDIHVHFVAGGAVLPGKLVRAARLSMDKYCSVAAMLGAGGVRITHGVSRILGATQVVMPAGVRIRVTEDLADVGRALVALGGAEVGEAAVWFVAERGGEAVGALRGGVGAAAELRLVDGGEGGVGEALSEAARVELAG